MTGHKEENIKYLRKYNPFIDYKKEYFDEIFSNSYQKEEMIQQIKEVPFFWENGNWYQLRSRFPKEEATYILKGLDNHKDELIILFGMGNIEVLSYLLKNTSDQTRIAVLEPNIQVFLYMLEHYDFRQYFSSPRFAFITGDEEIMKSQAQIYFPMWLNLVKNIKVIMQPNYYIYQGICLQVVQYIRNRLNFVLGALGNSLEDKLEGLKNLYQNVDACICSAFYGDCKKYNEIPAIIVASGPSLDKNIQYLKQAQGKALIIACDASYQICREHGVWPDAIASIERGEPTYRLFYKDKEMPEQLVLIAPCLLWPKIYKEFKGKMLLFSKNRTGMEKWWKDFFPNIETISAGHSCATLAFAFAKKAGCNPIILIGQDLAYTDDKFHSETIRKEIFQSENDIKQRYKDKKSLLWVESVNGGKVQTTDIFNLFRSFFEDSILIEKVHVIDATEGGALIHGADNRTLKEAIEEYCVKEIGFCLGDLLSNREVTKEEKIEYYDNILAGIECFQNRISKLMEMEESYEIQLAKYQKFDFMKASPKKLQKILQEMQRGNEIIQFAIKDDVGMRTFYQHIVKHTVIQVKQIGNQITGETIKRNWELQANLMNMIRITSQAVSKELSVMKEFLEKKTAKERE